MTGMATEVATDDTARVHEPQERPTSEEEASSTPGRSAAPKGVTVIIPTFNESENVSPVISGCLRALSDTGFEPEILVVDDDSPDYTWQYPQRLFGHDPRVRVIRRRGGEKGLGPSVVDGFRSATHDHCVVIDADLQHPPEKLPELVTELEDGADIAIGSRHAEDGDEEHSLPRRLVSKGAIACAKVGIPQARAISDPMAGFFAIRRGVIEGVDLEPKGYKILLEVLVKGDYETVAEVPYVFRERTRGESNLDAREVKNYLEHVGQLAVTSRGLDHVIEPARAVQVSEFALVGAIGVVVNMVVFSLLTLGSNLFYLVSAVAAFLAAVNWNFAGNWLLTFDRPAENVLRQYVGFHLVSLTGFIVYTITLAVGVQLGVHVLLANGIAILAGSGFNYLGSETAVFQTEETARTST